MAGLGPDLVQRLPEAKRTITGGKFGVQLQAVLITQAEQKLAPALGTLAKPVFDRQQFLPAAGIGADQHQHALPLVLQPRGEVDAVSPEIDITPSREGALLPVLMLLVPSFREAAHGRR